MYSRYNTINTFYLTYQVNDLSRAVVKLLPIVPCTPKRVLEQNFAISFIFYKTKNACTVKHKNIPTTQGY